MLVTPGEVVAQRFEILSHVGSGGMAAVFRAFDRERAAPAAVKLVRAGDPGAIERFEREARALAELVHPCVVGYLAHGRTADGALFLAMEWLDGEDLATRLAVSRLSVAETLAVAGHAGRALAAAHARGIVHRDVKPSNLFLVGRGVDRVKLLDFGVARLLDLDPLTRTGALVGTPLYMAPEQVTGGEADVRTDVFALGAVMFHAVTGQVPFPARNVPELVARLASADPAPRLRSRVPEVPAALDELVARMLAKDPARRPDDGALLAALDSGGIHDLGQLATAETGVVDAAAAPSADRAALIARGNQALADGRWQDARASFEVAVAAADTADARLGLAEALWWLGDPGCVPQYEAAYARLRRTDDPGARNEAAMVAISLALTHKKVLGNKTAARGWVARAASLLGEQRGPMHQVLWWAQGMVDHENPALAVVHYQRALDAAREAKDRDTELCALAGLGGALVAVGEVGRGMTLIDEAMAGTVGGEYEKLGTVVSTACCMVTACEMIAAADRMIEWCRAADQLMAKFGVPFLFADCRAHYGSTLVATGKWSDAERELLAVMAAAPRETAYHAKSAARLAELRVHQGRLGEAEQLIAEHAEQPIVRPVAAALAHAAGNHALAASLLHRYLVTCGTVVLDAVEALDLLVDASLAAGDRATAAATALRLGELARSHEGPTVAAHAAFAGGRVALAAGERDRARAELERAVDLFGAANRPRDAARARVALARALAGAHDELARAEARAASQAFERLGATRDASDAAALLQTLGSR